MLFFSYFAIIRTMKKMKFLYFVSIFAISVILLWNFTQTKTEYSNNKIKINNFDILEVTGEGYFYKNKINDKEYIQDIDLSNYESLNSVSLYVDNNTSYRFRYFNFFFTALPNSFIKYKNSIVSLAEGEFFWERIKLKKKANGNKIFLPGKKIIYVNGKGRIIISDKEINIWNYEGQTILKNTQSDIILKSHEFISIKENNLTKPVKIFKKPIILIPKDTLIINNANKTIVQFQWKDIIGFSNDNAPVYILRLYSSKNMGKIAEDQERSINGIFSVERKSESANIAVDFSALTQTNTVYWRVFPYDKTTNIEGEPSEIRKLKISDYLLNNKQAQLPPKLLIDPPSIAGNIVLLSGEADPKSRLFINGKEYEIDEEGKFSLNITYDKGGIYTVTFELISPSDRKNIKKKIIKIY